MSPCQSDLEHLVEYGVVLIVGVLSPGLGPCVTVSATAKQGMIAWGSLWPTEN